MKRLTMRRLVELIGAERALVLAQEFGGHQLPAQTERLARDLEVRRLADEGLSFREIERRTGVDAGNACRIAAAL